MNDSFSLPRRWALLAFVVQMNDSFSLPRRWALLVGHQQRPMMGSAPTCQL